MPVALILTDIEGTTTPIRFVHDVLFPYARMALPALVRDRTGEPEVASALALVRDAEPGRDELATLLGWMDRDAKEGPLKTLQGIAWRDGYAAGAIAADIYADVPPALRRWHKRGLRLAVYSSGSVEAQRLIFSHGPAGDLAPLFEAFFDTAIGAKRDAASYARIAADRGLEPGEILFLSDVGAELDAAGDSGLRTCQLLRPADGAVPSDAHPRAGTFDDLEPLLA